MFSKPDNASRRDVLPVLQSKQQTRAYYDRIAPYYDLLSERSERPVRRRALAELNAQPGEHVLEIGVGTGHNLVALAQMVGRNGCVVGVDISAQMLKRAQRHLRRQKLSNRAELRQADASALPFSNNTFDAVLMTFTLELFDGPDIPRALAECYRVLRPGGRIVVAALTKDTDSAFALRALEWTHAHAPGILDCRPIHVRQSITDAGFTVNGTATVQVWVPVDIVTGNKPRANPRC
ncbi:MAG: methyltransferase domain-containing protein [Phycisphaerales bacterium]|nr:methyltransferase domain-containing protein [Phycisphaerales bacterium]